MTQRKDNHFHQVLPVWLLLGVALLLFVIFSFLEFILPDSQWAKKGGFKELLTKKEEAIIDSTVNEALAELAYETGKKPEGPDTTVHHILIFGDSMTILVANRIAYYGKQNGYQVTSVTWYSSSTKVWGECDTLSHFIREYNPDFIIATLGSNELFIRNIEERSKYVETIKKQIGDIPFIWIGPPNWKKDTGINDMLEAAVSPKRFFRTDGMTLERGSDKVHPTQKAADIWADSIMRWIPSSHHPILNNFPDSVKQKPPHTVKLLSPPK